jgi:hypothetical protein
MRGAFGEGDELTHHSLFQILYGPDWSLYCDLGWGSRFETSNVGGSVTAIPGADGLHVLNDVDGAEDSGRPAMVIDQEFFQWSSRFEHVQLCIYL